MVHAVLSWQLLQDTVETQLLAAAVEAIQTAQAEAVQEELIIAVEVAPLEVNEKLQDKKWRVVTYIDTDRLKHTHLLE